MRVRMLFNASGSIDGNKTPSIGDEIEVSDPVGRSLVLKGQAEVVAVPETAKAETRPVKRRVEKRG